MKDTQLSICEKSFLVNAIKQNLRLDGRHLNEYRNITIHYGKEWGSCLVTIGDTRVLAQVSCDIQQPKASKPNEGLLHVNVEMSMAALHYEQGRQSDISIQVNRLLEKCLKESKCVDLEALCIVAEEKAWNIRIDLNVMNYEGNLAGCCSIAALASLAHFRHPDVTSTGEKVIIHSHSEKAPIPITLHHYPVIISYAIFDSGNKILSDPNFLEEKVADSLLMLSVNSYREFCGMHFEGSPLPSTDIVLRCSKDAATVAMRLVKQIKDTLAEDLKKRSENSLCNGLTESIDLDRILSRMQENLKIPLNMEGLRREQFEVKDKDIKAETDSNEDDKDEEIEMSEDEEDELDDLEENYYVKNIGSGTAELIAKDESESEMSDESTEVEIIKEVKPSESIDEIQLSGDSEEEDEIQVIHSSFNKKR